MIESSLRFLSESPDFVELHTGPDFRLDLRYATTNNFVGRDMYGNFRRAFVHRLTADKLNHALSHLRHDHPEYRFLIFDALRPRSVQRTLWAAVVGTPAERYIANPDLGSLHNFGFALDLTVLDQAGQELDMGAGYDDFRDIAQPQLEAQFAERGLLSPLHLHNRRLLRSAMERAGFCQLPHEWWHFDALPKEEVRARFQIVE